MKSHPIAFSLSLVLTGVFAMPPSAGAQFDLDLQAREIGNQLQQILNRITRYTTLLNQFTRLDCSAQGMAAGAQATPVAEAAVVCDTLNMLGAFRDSYRQLLQAPTDMLNTTPPLPAWRDVLQAADTVTEADIRNVYPGGAGAADAAVATFERRRNYADAVWSWPMPRPMPLPHSPTRWTQPGPRRNRRRRGPLSSRGTPRGDRGPALGQPCRSRSAVGSGEGGRGRTGQRTD